MSKLKIYRASAGSGKTYTLTAEFLKLLFKNPSNFRNTLAVTFTNKATAEMKGRILEKLFELSTNKEADYINDLVKEFKLTVEQVQSQAKLCLKLLLHDFSHFSISTIDSFFQRVIRSFAREAGLAGGFKVDLNTDKVLQKAVDLLVLELAISDNKHLKGWLLKFAEQKMESGKSWNFSKDIQNLGQEVFKEAFQTLDKTVLEKLKDKNFLENYEKQLQTIISNFKEKIKTFGEQGIRIIESHSLNFEDFAGKSRTPVKIFQKMASGNEQDFLKTDPAQKLIDTPENWYAKTAKDSLKNKITDAYNQGLNNLIKEALLFIETKKIEFLTAKAILSNIFSLGITTDIAQRIVDICQEENLFLLADSSKFLFKIINSNETPFIYEKTGTFYRHFMIDEFQDTSRMQWANFMPLIANSLGNNDVSLVVGDVKQSIYRWRSSDWKLLATQIETDFSHQGSDSLTLDTNWRSTYNVTSFNNFIFPAAAKVLQDLFNEELPGEETEIQKTFGEKIISAYSDVKQKVSTQSKTDNGHVNISFLEGDTLDEFRDTATQKTIDKIDELLLAGYSYKDICILVRTKGEGQIITNAILSGKYHKDEKKWPVISNEALYLESAISIKFIINQLKYLKEPTNQVLKASIQLLYNQLHHEEESINAATVLLEEEGEFETVFLPKLLNKQQLPLFELVESLSRTIPETTKQQQGVFIQAILNLVATFSADQTPDLNSFLNWWEESGHKEAVNIPEQQDAIKVMTIHKSKGLEFKALLIPFCNWDLDAMKNTNILWCTPHTAPFNQLSLVPVNYSSRLKDTIFYGDFLNERLHQYVDNLNLLYVALTRAENALFAFTKTPSGKKGSIKSISDLLFYIFENQASLLGDSEVSFANLWSSEEKIFESGSLQIQPPNNGKNNSDITTKQLPLLTTIPLNNRIAVRVDSEDFFSLDVKVSQINHGKIMHEIFEKINTPNDIPKAIQKLKITGKISTNEETNLEATLKELINQPIVKDWFNPNNKALNEATILSGKTYRPDRVVFNKENVTIIDYKFGDKQEDSHIQQVRNYMWEIKKMGYQQIKGYLWYITTNDILPVDIQAYQTSLF